MKKLLLLTGSAVAFLLFNSVESYACSCISENGISLKKQVKRAVKDADAVFTGEVLGIEKDSQNSVKVAIKVNIFWKGEFSKTVVVHTGTGNGDCGFKFEAGKKYLIYADGSAKLDSLSTSYCSRTTVLSDDTEDLKYLKKGLAMI